MNIIGAVRNGVGMELIYDWIGAVQPPGWRGIKYLVKVRRNIFLKLTEFLSSP